MVFTTAISPNGIISVDSRQNIRYTSMVQLPIPLILISSSLTFSGVLNGRLSISISLFITAAASAFM